MNCAEQCKASEDAEAEERTYRPLYASRHPPLVQPLQLSSFTERTRRKYGPPDLAHEWVALFQMISGSLHDHSTSTIRGLKSSMKMNIPDTVFLSPTGQPSVWYRTSSSKYVKARHLSHVTPESIVESLLLNQNGGKDGLCTIVHKRFEATILGTRQLQELASLMDNPCLSSPTKRCQDNEGDGAPLDDGGSDCTEIGHAEVPDRDRIPPFCVQQYIERAHGMSFLCLWRQYSIPPSSETTRPNVNANAKMKAVDSIFLVRRNDQWNDPMKSTLRDTARVVLETLELDGGDDVRTKRSLEEVGFDGDAVVPLLFHMKLLTSEIVSRMNRVCGSSRQVESLACEFFLHAETASPAHTAVSYRVFFSGLAGIQWQGHMASWETLREVDVMSRVIYDAVSIKPSPSTPRRRRFGDRGVPGDGNLSLVLFDELNPRFPSVQSPVIAEKQWKNKAVLLPPYVSPRHVNAEIPKVYRGGQFQPLLSPRQCHAVNRLHTMPRTFTRADAPRHPLSTKYADVEKELWIRQDGERVARGLQPRSPFPMGVLKPSPRAFSTPRSPRHRHSVIKEELV